MLRLLKWVRALALGGVTSTLGAPAATAPASSAPASTAPAATAAQQAFWVWFAANAQRLLEGVESNQEAAQSRVIGEMEAELAKVRPGLSALIGGPIDRKLDREIVITAQTDRKLFDDVTALVAAAPKTDRWKAVAFRPRMPANDEARVTYRGVTLGCRDVWFGAVELPVEEGGGLDLTMFVVGLTDENKPMRVGAAVLLLDQVLGEYDAGTQIARLHAEPLPPGRDPKALGLRPFDELPALIDARKAAPR